MKADLKAKFNNNYKIELIDSVTGQVKQSGEFHNIATVNINACLVGGTEASSAEASNYMAYNDIAWFLAIGSGTKAPAYTDTALSGFKWSVQASWRMFEWIGDYTGKATAEFRIPASSAYTGTITEVGLCARADDTWLNDIYTRMVGLLATRSLLTDSEGNIISFEKTDLDILKIIVTVEVTLTSNSDSFKIFKHPFILRSLLDNTVTTDRLSILSILGSLNLCRYYYDLESVNVSRDLIRIDTAVSQASAPVSMYNSSTSYIKYKVNRLGTTEVTSERYFKGVAVPAIGYWKLPDESVLPAYTISGISVGTGDGTKTKFDNPLCYFKKDTDKVYKNGVLLTRGVDYTINNVGNKLCLPEVAELTPPSSIKSNAVSNTTLSVRPLFLPTANSVADKTKQTFCFSNSSPLYIEYEEAITLNCLKCTGGLRAMSGTNGYNALPANVAFYLDASTDGETYEQVGSATIVGNGWGTETAFTMDFTDTTARYWRLRTNYTGGYPIAMYYENADNPYYIMLNRKDPYIVFTQAPANGDIITMDVDMDVIMKNSNFVVDIGCQINFSV